MERTLLSIFLACILFLSCSSNEEKQLRAKLSEDNISAQKDTRHLSEVQVAQYQNMELSLNEKYVKDLKNVVDSSFEKQITTFEDEELGVIAGYKYMFKYFTLSNEEWDDLQIQLSDKYFNTLNVEQMALNLSMKHHTEVKDLRTKFSKSKILKINVLHLPDSKIYLGSLNEHSRNNLLIELGTTILDILLGLLITWIVFNIIGYAVTGPISCIVTIVSFVIILIVSVICTNYNDDKLIESLRQQKVERQVNYSNILEDLNNNTVKFYEAYK